MSRSSGQDYYVARKSKLLRGFDRFAKRARPRLEHRYGEPLAHRVLVEARLEFERLIPELPYIGGRENLFTPVMVVNGWLLAVHRAMLAEGRSAEETVKVFCEVTDAFFRSFPRFVLRLGGRLGFTRWAKRVLRKQAARSQQRRYPQDFVYVFREGGEDDWALEFSECAVQKFYEAQGVEELKPYCNFVDVTYSRLMGMGVDARETLGLGCSTCRLRYKHGRETVVPERLQGLLGNA